ncbi:DUF4245 domain-containing protein [Nakamurella flavida]|uniref:DUF4245 domain-containing protein n=1 Tax=Nakamurella flavida TaxID=363630 RepID=A0A939C2S6_9ACTN|nr:DUF4245 domain-containing protein [Nakamurella flavida]MBM9476895.1 DUF4245 domain-containing protein [Nakamurella flavida]MDP9779839.1 hypothetical protein [Nakamurella flavida]
MAARRTTTMRDMVLSMGLLTVIALLGAAFYFGFSFSPGGPTAGENPTADVTRGFDTSEASVGFPVLTPTGLPAAFQPSSFSRTAAGGSAPPAVRGGWLVDGERFITLIESSAPVADVLTAELGEQAEIGATGVVQAGGREWSLAVGRRDEAAWFLTVPAAQVPGGSGSGQLVYLITGTATPKAFQTLAAAVTAQLTAAG